MEKIRQTVLVHDLEQVKKMKVLEIDMQLAYLCQSDKEISTKSKDNCDKKLSDLITALHHLPL